MATLSPPLLDEKPGLNTNIPSLRYFSKNGWSSSRFFTAYLPLSLVCSNQTHSGSLMVEIRNCNSGLGPALDGF